MQPATITLADLASRQTWVGWREEKGHGRRTKVPYDPRTGRRAESDNATTWASREEAESWTIKERGDGVGIMLCAVDGAYLCGIDLDTCRDKDTGNIASWAQEIIDRFASYTEVSPSGTGAKIFFTFRGADLPAIETLFNDKHGRAFKNGGGGEHPPAIEVYRGRHYFTVTNESIGPHEELRLVDVADLQWLICEAGPKFVGKSGKGRDDSRSAKAFRAGAVLKAEGRCYGDVRDALLAHTDPGIAEWARTKGLAYGEREMRRIFDRALRGAGVINIRAPYDIARLFLDELATPLRCHRGAFYEWDGVAWPEAPEDGLRARIYAFLDQCKSKSKSGDLCPVKPNAQMVSSVLDALRAAAHLDEGIAPPAWLDAASNRPLAGEIVACANGFLHLPTLKLLPHTPLFFTHNALDFAYEPCAPKPRLWLAFLRQLWPDDGEAIATLQEFFGYCLTGDTRQQKAFLLVGPKRSGKGTIARVLARLIGNHNCVAPTLAGLGTNFGLAPLIGKRVAIISDARLSGRADQHAIAERILSITGEDAITIDRKYLPAWTGQLQTRILILSNELPRLADASGALASRFILLRLTESFYGKEDQELTRKLLGKLPGILNLGDRGLDPPHQIRPLPAAGVGEGGGGAARGSCEPGRRVRAGLLQHRPGVQRQRQRRLRSLVHVVL